MNWFSRDLVNEKKKKIMNNIKDNQNQLSLAEYYLKIIKITQTRTIETIQNVFRELYKFYRKKCSKWNENMK